MKFCAIVLVVALFAAANAQRRSNPCPNRCAFRFCNGNRNLYVKGTPNDRALTGPICLRGKNIGIVNTGESFVARPYSQQRPVRISKFMSKSLIQPLAPTLFKAYPIIPRCPRRRRRQKRCPRPTKSGVGHQVFQKGELRKVTSQGGLCVILPITHYQVVKKGNVVDNVFSRKTFRDCISVFVR